MACASSTTTKVTRQPEAMPRSEPSSGPGAAGLRVGGAELVPPVADAVRLIDHHEAHRAAGDDAAQRALERLGRQVEELDLAAAERGHAVAPLLERQRRVDRRGAEAEPHERVDLVLHERDERRDHEYGAGQDLGRNLKRERLAGTGGHDADAVATGEHRVDDAPLPGAELAIAEDGLEHLLRVGVARGVEQRGAGVEHEVFPVRVRVEGPEYSPGSGVTVGSPRSVQPRQPPSSETTFV